MRLTALRHTLFLDFEEVFTPQTGKVGGGEVVDAPPLGFFGPKFLPLD